MSKNIIWNAFGNLAYLGSMWLITVFVTREMGFEQAGIFSLAMSVTNVFQSVALFGMRNYQVSDLKKEFTDKSYLVSRLITCTTAFLLCAVFGAVNRYPFLTLLAICAMMWFRIAESFSDVLHGMLQKAEKLDIVGVSFTIRAVLIAVGFLIGNYIFGSVNVVIICMALCSLIVTMVFDWRAAARIAGFRFKKQESVCLSGLLQITLPLCLYQVFSTALVSAPRYMLERIMGETALGIYSAVFTPVMLIQALSGYLFLPFAGKFAKAWDAGDRLTFLRTATRIILFISAFSGIVLVCAYIGKDLLVVVFGEEIATHTGLLLPAVICSLLVSLYNLLGMLETIVRDRMGQLTASVIGMLVSIVLLPAAIRVYGINGTNIGHIAGQSSALLYMLWRLFKTIRKCEKT